MHHGNIDHPGPEPSSVSRKWPVLIVTSMAVFLAGMDANIVTIALPKITTDLLTSISVVGWVINGYLLAFVALVILSGKLADVVGRRSIYVLGFVTFGLFSALCGVSQTITELIAFRVLQGVSASFIFVVSRPLLLETFPPKEVSFAFGVNAAVTSVAAVIGPVVGGLLVALDWRLIFYVNVPIAILATVMGLRYIPGASHGVSLLAGFRSINLLSSLLLAVIVSLLLVGISSFDIRFGLVGVLVLIPLVVNEARVGNPLLNRELRTNKGFVYSVLAISTLSVGYSGIVFAMPFYYLSVINLSSQLSGILLAPLSVAVIASSIIAGRMYGRMKDPLILAILGSAGTGVGLILIALGVDGEADIWVLSVTLFLTGFTFGLYWTSILTAALQFVKPQLVAVANATWAMFTTLSSAVSVAITAAIAAYFLPQSLASQGYSETLIRLSPELANLLKSGLRDGLFVLGLINFASLPVVYLVLREYRRLNLEPLVKNR